MTADNQFQQINNSGNSIIKLQNGQLVGAAIQPQTEKHQNSSKIRKNSKEVRTRYPSNDVDLMIAIETQQMNLSNNNSQSQSTSMVRKNTRKAYNHGQSLDINEQTPQSLQIINVNKQTGAVVPPRSLNQSPVEGGLRVTKKRTIRSNTARFEDNNSVNGGGPANSQSRGNKNNNNNDGDFDQIIDEALNRRHGKGSPKIGSKQQSVSNQNNTNQNKYKTNMQQLQQQQNQNPRSSINDYLLDNGAGTISKSKPSGTNQQLKESFDDGIHQLIEMAKLRRQESRRSSKGMFQANQIASSVAQYQNEQSNLPQLSKFDISNKSNKINQHHLPKSQMDNTTSTQNAKKFNIDMSTATNKQGVSGNNNYVDDETPWTYRVKQHAVSANTSPRANIQHKIPNTTIASNTKIDPSPNGSLLKINQKSNREQLSTVTPDHSFISFDNANANQNSNNLQSVKIRDSNQFKRGSVMVTMNNKPFMKAVHHHQDFTTDNDIVPAQGQGGGYNAKKSKIHPGSKQMPTGSPQQQDSIYNTQEDRGHEILNTGGNKLNLPSKKFKNDMMDIQVQGTTPKSKMMIHNSPSQQQNTNNLNIMNYTKFRNDPQQNSHATHSLNSSKDMINPKSPPSQSKRKSTAHNVDDSQKSPINMHSIRGRSVNTFLNRQVTNIQTSKRTAAQLMMADDLSSSQAPNSALLPPNKNKRMQRGGSERKTKDAIKQKIVIVQQQLDAHGNLKKNVHFKDEVEGNSLCDVVVIESYKKYYNSNNTATCSCTCSIF